MSAHSVSAAVARVRSAGDYLVPGLERGLRILGEFSPREPVLDAPELSRRLEIPRSTVFRLLQTLETLGFLERANGDGDYRLGVAVLRLGFEYLNSLELTDLGLPLIARLRDQTGLTTHIVIRDGRDIVFVAKAQGRASPLLGSVRVSVGTRLPAHATTHGQVLMGDLTLGELQKLYPEAQLEPFMPSTPSNVEALYERIRADARQGYAMRESSFEPGIRVASAPVRDDTGRIAAAVAMTVPQSAIDTPRARDSLIEQVRHTADELSKRLNYRPQQEPRGRTSYMKTLGLK